MAVKTTIFNFLTQLDVILANQETMEKQMSTLSDAVTAVSSDLDALSTKLDIETTEIGKVLALLQTTNPDVPAAVTALQGIHTRVGGLSATVDQHVSTLDAALPAAP